MPDCTDEQREDLGVLWVLIETGADCDTGFFSRSLLNSPRRTYKADLQSLKFGHIDGFVSC